MLPVCLDGEKDPAAKPNPEAGESVPKSPLKAAFASCPGFVLRIPGAVISCAEALVVLTPPASGLPADLAKFSNSAAAELSACLYGLPLLPSPPAGKQDPRVNLLS